MFELGLPKSPRFLINTVILTILLFTGYYGLLPLPFIVDNSLHKKLTDAYYKDFWQEPQLDSAAGVSLQIVWPRFVSSLVEREIVVSLTNNSDFDIEPVVVIFAIFPEIASNGNPAQQWLIWQTESQFGSNSYNGRSILNLGTIPPQGQVTESVWARVAPVGDAPDQIPFDAYVQWVYPHNSNLTCETDESMGQNGEICILRVAPAPQATVNPLKTIRQGIVRVLLLPPLTNLFLPLLALFLSLSFEGLRTTIANDFARKGSGQEPRKSKDHDNSPSQPVGGGSDPTTPPDNRSEEAGNIGDNGWSQTTSPTESGTAQEAWSTNQTWLIRELAPGILGLVVLIIYAIFLLWLIVDIVVGWLDPDRSSSVIFFWVFILVFTAPIVFYVQKQQKGGGQELAKTLGKPLSISIVQQNEALNTKIEKVQTDFQQALGSLQNSVQQCVSQEDFGNIQQEVNTEINKLQAEINNRRSDRIAYAALPDQIVRLQDKMSVLQSSMQEYISQKDFDSQLQQFAVRTTKESNNQAIGKEIDLLKKRVGEKLNYTTYEKEMNDYKKLSQAFRKVFDLILKIEQMRAIFPNEPGRAKPYWEQLARIFSSKETDSEVKQEYQNRYDELQSWFVSDTEQSM